MFHLLQEATSTNDLAKQSGSHGDIFVAERQSAGRGQRGNKWLSPAGVNITLSLVAEPTLLEASHQFFISMVAALSLVDLLKENGIDAKVKWTNDIYIGDKKVAGILIENSVTGGNISRSVIGIGLNVNQSEFDPALPNPTSMMLEASRHFLRMDLMGGISRHFYSLFDKLERDERRQIFERYNSLLYRRGERHKYRLADGTLFDGVIEGVKPTGELLIRDDMGKLGAFLFKEVEFLI